MNTVATDKGPIYSLQAIKILSPVRARVLVNALALQFISQHEKNPLFFLENKYMTMGPLAQRRQVLEGLKVAFHFVRRQKLFQK